jgi:hypothetical protein
MCSELAVNEPVRVDLLEPTDDAVHDILLKLAGHQAFVTSMESSE